MKTLEMLFLILLGVTLPSMAQEHSVINPAEIEQLAATGVIPLGQFGTAKLSWNWVPGPEGGEPSKIYIRCARAGGTRDIKKDVDGQIKTILAKDVVLKPGTFDCTLQGWNETGEGPVSVPFPFALKGGLPPAITDIRLE